MRKKLKKGVGITALVTAIMLSAPVESSFAAPPTYLSNIYDEVMISRIVPAEQYLEVTYNKLGIRADGEIPEYFNIQFGGLTDAELYSMGTGQGTNIKLVGATREQLFGGVPVSGQIGVINESIIGRFGPKLINNTLGRLDYIIVYEGGGGNQLSRADYSRCVNSSVFISGEATECRMERIGVNKVQYQPYTAEGIRVEIPADEDAILTAMTDNWRPEAGEWGPEWYSSDDSGDDENGDDEVSGGEGNNGSDEGDINDGNDGDGTDNNEGEINEKGVETGEESGGENPENAGGTEDTERGKGGTSAEAGVDGDEVVVALVTEELISEAAVANSVNSASDAVAEGRSDSSNNWGSSNDGGDGNDQGSSENGNNSSDENVSEDYAVVIGEKTSAEQDVGVPNLGKEPDNQPNWSAIMSICLASVAGLVGWAFLFFGKSKRNKRKETKE